MTPCVLWILAGLLRCLVCADKDVPKADDYNMYQREIDPSFIVQKLVEFPLLVQGEPVLSPRGRRPGSSNLNDFPPGKPTKDNIGNICRKGRAKVTYGADNLPQTGYSHLSRQGNAINSAEAGYTRCCGQTEKLSCALEVWKDAMEEFCSVEFTIKTRPYFCCNDRGVQRETCFTNQAPVPNYISAAPLLEVGSAEVPSVPAPRSLRPCSLHSPKCSDKPEWKYRLSDLAFPPGEPKSSNIQNICKLRKFRPLYTDHVLPKTGFGQYVRGAKAINRAESEFKKCCKAEDVACAHNGWKKALSKFCAAEHEVKTRHHECCKKKDQTAMFHCFASEAPFPEYDKEVETLNLSNITETVLEKMCTECKLITKQKQLPLLISGLKDSCCGLDQDEKLLCAQEQKEKFMKTLCGPKKGSWKDTQNCCSKDELETEECFSFYLQNISIAVSHRVKAK